MSLKEKFDDGFMRLLVILAVIIVGFGFLTNSGDRGNFGAQTDKSCTVTESVATIGADESSTILAAHTRRAWAKIEALPTATNTPWLSFDAAAAIAGTGHPLIQNRVSGTSTNPVIFGRDAELKYTGIVYGITDVGSSTVLVTECRY